MGFTRISPPPFVIPENASPEIKLLLQQIIDAHNDKMREIDALPREERGPAAQEYINGLIDLVAEWMDKPSIPPTMFDA